MTVGLGSNERAGAKIKLWPLLCRAKAAVGEAQLDRRRW